MSLVHSARVAIYFMFRATSVQGQTDEESTTFRKSTEKMSTLKISDNDLSY